MCAEDRGAEPGSGADADGAVAGAVKRRKEWYDGTIRKDCLFGGKGSCGVLVGGFISCIFVEGTIIE